ncbi:peptide/nickel transport system permease protein [Pseudarthrobacter equi]|uniref:Peptide/nickel transport system permease protein n=1 Tax=Pseudarthrobacter equi TaxID=728066 RepID=A0A1H1U484_9MICC|nr:ABC transporter permease [Pseudarthrobacter equi]SDS66699.1 peptide/nickel transport system permease protein [Pseudarthrobacter equi]
MSQQLLRDSPGPAADALGATYPGREEAGEPAAGAGQTSAAAAVVPGKAAPSAVARLARTARVLPKSPGLVLAVLVIAVVILWAVIPGAFTHWPPDTGVPSARLKPPSAEHWFGTDSLGRDLFSRVVHGSATSLAATAVAVAVGLVAGSLLGLLAGFLRGWVDDAIMRVMDVLLAIPSLLLSLALITVLGFGTVNIAIAVGIASVANFARIMRAESLRVGSAVYVEAARSSGVRWHGILLRHVLPNAAGPVLALSALEFGMAVLSISSLSFLGFGAPPPAAEWGSLVAGGRDYLVAAWWLVTLPGLVIAAVVLSTNRISHAFQDPERNRT